MFEAVLNACGNNKSKAAQVLGITRNTLNTRLKELCDVKREYGVAYGAADDAKAGNASRISYVIGPDGRIAQAHPKVSPKSHPKEILASL